MDLGSISFGAGQLHDKFAAAAFACSSADFSPMGAKYARADGKPETSSIRSTALKGLKDSGQHVRRDARATIENPNAIAPCADLPANVDG
jgi:hypothetical protein